MFHRLSLCGISNRVKLCLALVLCMCFGSACFAHQQQQALTRIEYNPRTEKLEIMHRFVLHDAEHAVSEIFDKPSDIISSKQTQEKFTSYVLERFGIYRSNNEALALELVGYEVEGKHFWIYQESQKPDSIEGLRVVHNALRDIWIAQTNTVNIKVGDKRSTLTFNENIEVLSISSH